MTSYERVLTTIRGRLPDRVPVVPELFGVTARISGYSILEYVTDGGVISGCQLRALQEIGHDAVFAFADLNVEVEALGCTLHYREDAYPAVRDPVLVDTGDIEDIRLPDPLKDGRMPVVIEACSRLREAVRDNALIAACVVGPVSIAAGIMGMENFLYQLSDNPGGIEKVLDLAEQVAAGYGKALIRAGAHCIVVFDPVSSPMVITPELFIKHGVPGLRRMFRLFSAVGSVASWISIAGPTQRIMPFFKGAGVELATVDYVVPLPEAFRVSGGIALNGNIRPYAFVSSTKEEIMEETRRCLMEAEGKGRYIAGSGCEVPVESEVEGITALVEAAREYSYKNAFRPA